MRVGITETPKMIGRHKAEFRKDHSVMVSRMVYVKISWARLTNMEIWRNKLDMRFINPR